MWRWDNSDPFGANLPNENPSGLGTFTYNQRFDGTYYDVETNTLHNGFRTLDASLGRYLQSDPIGLRAGLNTYLHVGADPLKYSDRFGLDRWYDPGWGGGAGENWWWNCPPSDLYPSNMIKREPLVVVPWLGKGNPPRYDRKNNNFCNWRPVTDCEAKCIVTSTTFCTVTMSLTGLGLVAETISDNLVCSPAVQKICEQSCRNPPDTCVANMPYQSNYFFGTP